MVFLKNQKSIFRHFAEFSDIVINRQRRHVFLITHACPPQKYNYRKRAAGKSAGQKRRKKCKKSAKKSGMTGPKSDHAAVILFRDHVPHYSRLAASLARRIVKDSKLIESSIYSALTGSVTVTLWSYHLPFSPMIAQSNSSSSAGTGTSNP